MLAVERFDRDPIGQRNHNEDAPWC
jgi:hypothetical protein